MAEWAPVFVHCYPNAGLPNTFGQYDETPELMQAKLREFAMAGFINLVGGCCGTRPAHIKAIAEAVKDVPPRIVKSVVWTGEKPPLVLSGLEPMALTENVVFVNVGERCNVSGSRVFARMIKAGEFEKALQVPPFLVLSAANMPSSSCRWHTTRSRPARRCST